jgi:hypothetical protein
LAEVVDDATREDAEIAAQARAQLSGAVYEPFFVGVMR